MLAFDQGDGLEGDRGSVSLESNWEVKKRAHQQGRIRGLRSFVEKKEGRSVRSPH